jgi:DNA-binding transcriptional ArsR family regulator
MKTTEAIAALGALAQETRLAIFRLLIEAGPRGLPAGAIAGKLEVPAPSLSFHLAQLKHAGLITQQRRSRSLIYACDAPRMDSLVGYLTANCCGGGACPPECGPAFSGAAKRYSRRASS